jgi:DNA repair protein RadC
MLTEIFQLEEVKAAYKPKVKARDRYKVTTSKGVEAYLRHVYESSPDINDISHVETFVCLYLNQGNKILGHAVISKGGIGACVVDVRVILQKALLSNASALILCHNHPSGNMSASEPDKQITQKVKNAAALLDIRVLDHVILSPDEGEYLSFADSEILNH